MTKDDVINGIIGVEGGYTNNPNDTGGPTRWGITQSTARANGYQGDMSQLPRDTAVAIYDKIYWTTPKFDQVSQLSMPIAVELMDTGVNMGPAVAAKFLQRCLNVFNNQGKAYSDITADGQLGNQSLNALSTFLKARGNDGEQVLLKALNCLQGARYIELAEDREQNEAFIYGWIKNRVSL